MQRLDESNLPEIGDLVVLAYANEQPNTVYDLVEITGYHLDCFNGAGCYDPDYSHATHWQKVIEI